MTINPRWRLVIALAMVAVAPSAGVGQATTQERAISLDEAIAEALIGNAGVAVARAETEMAHADVGTASSYLWPRVDVSTGWTRSDDPVFAFGTKLRQGIFTESDLALDALNNPEAIDDWASAATLQWKLLSPQVWAGRSAASNAADAADWKELRTREATVLRTEILYLDAQRAAAQTRAAMSSEDAARSARDVFVRREAEGFLTRAEVLQAEADLQGSTAARIDAERRETDAYRRLAVFLGWGPEVTPVLTDTLELVDVEPAAVPVDPAATGTLPAGFDPAQRADLHALGKARDAAAANSSRARLGYLPELDAFAGYSMHGSSLFASDGDNWTGGVALRWNIFSGLSRSADTKRADAQRAMAETRFDEALRSARAEVMEAADAVDAARRAAGAAIVADSAASLGRELMRMRFEEGLATANDLLAADSRAARARGRAIDASAAYRMAQARLRFVTTQHSSE
ncbi:MAG: TolC family protein [marine benthic group bacterium]|nr:TolC family protein [Gemmatimonadota bacterium]MCL7973000.1 TolC family protein [Gemmatimonadota bacterium]MCL7979165.1 TolC family protein [Gemmatimonadota bacterium]